MVDSVRVANNICRKCGHCLDAATGLSSKLPKACDVSICINCATIHVFNDKGQLFPPTSAELESFAQDADLQRIIRRARDLILFNKHKRRG